MEDKIQIILEAVQRAKAEIDQSISDINRLNDANAKSAQHHKNSAAAVREHAGELIKFALEVFAVTEGLKLLVETAIELPERMARMAAAAGATVEAFSTMAGAAQRFHVDNNLLSISLKNLSSATADAIKGDANRIAQFQALGISTQFLRENQNNLLAIFLKVSDSFKQHADGVNKSKLAQDLFGRSAREMIEFLNQGSGSIQQMQERVKELGGEISETSARQSHELNVAIADFKTEVAGAVRGVVQGLLPALTDLIHDFTNLPQGVRAAAEAVIALTVAILASRTAMGPYALAIAAITTTLLAGVEAWHAYKAAQEEALTKNNLTGQQERFTGALKKQIDDLKAAGKIQSEEAQKIKEKLDDSLKVGSDKEISETQQFVRNRIRILKELEAIHPESVGGHGGEGGKDQLPAPIDPGIAKQKADGAFAILRAQIEKMSAAGKGLLDVEQKNLDAHLEQQRISVEEWAAKSVAIDDRRVSAEQRNAEKLYRATVDAANKALAETTDPKEVERLNTEKELAEIQLSQKLNTIQQQRAERRLQIEQTTEEKSRQITTQGISAAQAEASQATSDFQARISEITFGEQRGQFLNVFKELDQAEADYLDKLNLERDALLGILDTIEKINSEHPGTFSNAYIQNVQKFVAENEKKQIESQRTITEQHAQLRDKQLSGVQSMFGNMAQAAKAFGKEGFAAYKAFAIAQATIDTARAAIAAYQSVVGIPFVGPVLAPIAAAAAIAAGAAQIGAISAQKFASGGLIRGPGTTRSDSVPIMASDMEYVIDAETVQKVGAERMEQIHQAMKSGGVSFRADGGLVAVPRSRQFASGGLVTADTSGGGPGGGALKVAFIETRNHLRQWMREEGVGVAIDGFGSHGNQVVA